MSWFSPDYDPLHRDDEQKVLLKHEVAVLLYLGSDLERL